MGELLIRRREMILPSAAPVGPLIYSLYNHAVTVGDVIDTGIKPFANGADMTILFDMTTTSNPTSTSSPAYRFILITAGMGDNGLRVGKPSQWNSGIRARFLHSFDDDNTAKICTAAAGRKRIVITHVGGTKTIRAIGKAANNTPLDKTVEGDNYTLNTDAVLTFGYESSSVGYGLPPGTITKAEVYNTILSDDEINAFLA